MGSYKTGKRSPFLRNVKRFQISPHQRLKHTFVDRISPSRKGGRPNYGAFERFPRHLFRREETRVRQKEVVVQVLNELREDLRGQTLRRKLGDEILTRTTTIELNYDGRESWQQTERRG
jgi:ribosomal protein L15